MTTAAVNCDAATTWSPPYPFDPDNPSGSPTTGQPYVAYTDQNGVEQYVSHPTPYIVSVYYGGHSHVVSAAEATALTAAGYGACLS